MRWKLVGLAVFPTVLMISTLGVAATTSPAAASVASPSLPGYWLMTAYGSIYSFNAPYPGSPPNGSCAFDSITCTGIAAAPGGAGVWVSERDGTLWGLGSTHSEVDCPVGRFGNAPTVGVAAASDGGWLVGSDGGVFAVCGAPYFGSMGGRSLNQPIVGMASTPDGGGYWLVAADGGIFTFGDARYYGSTGAIRLNQPVVGMAATPDGGGYWLVASDGGVFAFGDAGYFGSMGGKPLNAPMAAIAANPDGTGYWTVAQDGGVFSFGDAPYLGSLAGQSLDSPVVGIASRN